MIRGRFNDDYGWDGGNVVPWGPTQCEEAQTLPDLVDNSDSKSPSIKSLNKENLSEFEALMLGEISNDGSSEDELDMDTATSSSDDEVFFPLMDLPLEIRQQIYHWIHLMNPIRLTQFAPWYPIPVNRGYFVKAVTALPCDPCDASSLEVSDETPRPIATRTAPLLSPWRPYSCIPTSMLRVSKQIYYESRELPFQNNEFVFVNWFASGLWAARSFMKGLQAWQMQTMRQARLELLSRDLSGRYVDEWRELCGAWAEGLRGLRLKILSSGGGVGTAGGVSWVVAGSPQRGAPTAGVRDEEGKVEEWIENGLKQLKRLQCLEVELCAADWDDNNKLDWCRSLEKTLNESKTETEQHVRVCCVERARD
ncbi:hypothetical protein F4781DRAFT_423561 [Annulohypoxylon bovei var. microspora]|nr:hypothetical protein F4781DRAFT_423561 [Annulohypoxylon bovei var. microspora]